MKRLLTAALAALSIAMPVQARIDPDADELLTAMQSDGIHIEINSERCNERPIYGLFTFVPKTVWRVLTLCPGDTADAVDHSTVRHEAIHAIQWCANTRRGTPFNTPLQADYDRFQQEVFANLYIAEIEAINSNYHKSDWRIEYEAFLYERTLSAAQILEAYNTVCGPTNRTH